MDHHICHESLLKVLAPEKELIVVDTYQHWHSAFFEKRCKEDPRIIHLTFKRPLLRRVVGLSSEQQTEDDKREIAISGDLPARSVGRSLVKLLFKS